MGGQSSHNKPERRIRMLEESRRGLAEERDRAVRQVNRLLDQLTALSNKHQEMQQHMVRWIALFMLDANKHEVTFQESFLKKADDWAVVRNNDPEKRTVTWKIMPREEFEADQKLVAFAAPPSDGEAGEQAKLDSDA